MPDPDTHLPFGAPHPWSLDQIAFDRIAHESIVNEETWFYVLAGASFVESFSDLFTHNLLGHMEGDTEVTQWLRERWEPEELQHGRALRRYVETVWPAFDWQAAFDGFCADYRPFCKPELLEPTRALEMVARCVVETGTSGLYGLLHKISPEPVLTALVGHIRSDEVGHFKYFYHFFLRYREIERPSRWQVARVLRERLGEIGQEDAYLAVKNAFEVRNPGLKFSLQDFQRFQHNAGHWARADYPYEMTVKMLLKPMRLPGFINRMAMPLLMRQAQRVIAP
ncbi:ferritin-like domain-containing protein [Sulfuriferula sp. GW1]|uniref:ferritin-like domain-containing protein n=1 Tax=Sulfuriferula sp. GW1 TaxID=3345111 RepID=UPI0039B0CB27